MPSDDLVFLVFCLLIRIFFSFFLSFGCLEHYSIRRIVANQDEDEEEDSDDDERRGGGRGERRGRPRGTLVTIPLLDIRNI